MALSSSCRFRKIYQADTGLFSDTDIIHSMSPTSYMAKVPNECIRCLRGQMIQCGVGVNDSLSLKNLQWKLTQAAITQDAFLMQWPFLVIFNQFETSLTLVHLALTSQFQRRSTLTGVCVTIYAVTSGFYNYRQNLSKYSFYLTRKACKLGMWTLYLSSSSSKSLLRLFFYGSPVKKKKKPFARFQHSAYLKRCF